MKKIDPVARVRSEYGSVKAALEYCANTLSLGRGASARQLGVDRKTLRCWVSRFPVEFPERSKMHPECRSVGHPSHAERNRRHAKVRVSDLAILTAVSAAKTCRDLSGVSLSTVYSRFGSWREAKVLCRQLKRGLL